MITFNCPRCGREFRVRDDAEGKSGMCKSCGCSICIPKIAAVAPSIDDENASRLLEFLNQAHEVRARSQEFDFGFLMPATRSPEPGITDARPTERADLIARFTQQLPFTTIVLGREVEFRSFTNGKLVAQIADVPNSAHFDRAYTAWERRRAVLRDSFEERTNIAAMKLRLSQSSTLEAFLSFFLAQPIGLRMFLFDKEREFASYPGRLEAIDEALFTWDALSHWDKNTNGKLKLSIPCAGYRNGVSKEELSSGWVWPCLCSVCVANATGCCGTHCKPNARTLFNYYPFFEQEGHSELTK